MAFGSTQALGGVSLRVAPGESVAVTGASGSGKSTLLHCLTGLRRPTSGTVIFEGAPISALSDNARSRLRLERMGIVFQFGELLPELTLAGNVALPTQLLRRRPQAANEAAQELLEAFGIAHLAGQFPSDVSGGERQRAAVARALAHKPAVVFADEPTGSLDSGNAQIVIEALLRQTRTQQQSVVLVTHERRFAEQCDRVVEMRDGLFVSTVLQ
ncbi:MAG: ABC transporter ATP-binding protein [bacterium]|nr:ABC transporter ATP-binding protein [bacterium]MCY4272825.1 ABC transporter ATP-binding protein [bacterium]